MFDNFPKDPIGQVYLANAYLASEYTLIKKDVIDKYLKNCETFCCSNPGQKPETTIKSFKYQTRDEWKTRTDKPAPILIDNITTTIPIESFDSSTRIEKISWLFDFDELGNEVPVQGEDLKIEPFIPILEEAKNIRSDAILGGFEMKPQWFAPEMEVNALKSRPQRENADAIRDALGLAHYGKGVHLGYFHQRQYQEMSDNT